MIWRRRRETPPSDAEKNLALTITVAKAMNELVVEMSGTLAASLRLIEHDSAPATQQFIESSEQVIKRAQEAHERILKFLMTMAEHTA